MFYYCYYCDYCIYSILFIYYVSLFFKLFWLLKLLMLLCLLYDVDRFALIWVFLTIFGSRNVLQLRNALTIWEISSVLPYTRDGWLTLSPMLSTLIITMVELDRVIWWVMAVRFWASWTGFHINYRSKSQFCISQ